jgi:hypothetical protein
MSSNPIYHSSKAAPYVYLCTHKITEEFYIGYRSNNNVPSSTDLGSVYFTSSSIVKPRFSEFNFKIIAEFLDKGAAYDFEQYLISLHFHNPNCLNRSCYYGKKRFKRTEASIIRQQNQIPGNITATGLAEIMVRKTGNVLKVSNNLRSPHHKKMASFGTFFRIKFVTDEEREEFLKFNPHFVVGINDKTANEKISKTLSGRKKGPRTVEHQAKINAAVRETIKGGVHSMGKYAKSASHRQKISDTLKRINQIKRQLA